MNDDVSLTKILINQKITYFLNYAKKTHKGEE